MGLSSSLPSYPFMFLRFKLKSHAALIHLKSPPFSHGKKGRVHNDLSLIPDADCKFSISKFIIFILLLFFVHKFSCLELVCTKKHYHFHHPSQNLSFIYNFWPCFCFFPSNCRAETNIWWWHRWPQKQQNSNDVTTTMIMIFFSIWFQQLNQYYLFGVCYDVNGHFESENNWRIWRDIEVLLLKIEICFEIEIYFIRSASFNIKILHRTTPNPLQSLPSFFLSFQRKSQQ